MKSTATSVAALLGAATMLVWSSSALAQAAQPATAYAPPKAAAVARPAYVPVTTAMLENPPPGDWLHMSRTYDQQRFSPLTQITKANVGQLKLAWARGLPEGPKQQSTPLVHNGIMYLWAPSDGFQAIDATNGALIWAYKANYEGGGGKTKSVGIYENMVYYATANGLIRALDATSGEVKWETPMTGRSGTANSAGGVLVADGKVLMNGSCSAFNPAQAATTGAKGCYIVALDARTGKEAWKFMLAPGQNDPGGNTWTNIADERRIASPWGVPGSYDPELGLTYWGVANPAPYTMLARYSTDVGKYDGVPRPVTSPTDLYSNSTVAIDIKTGKLKWYWQGLPGDDWDADNNQERTLLNVPLKLDPQAVKWINPKLATDTSTRKVVIYQAEGGGQYAVDRATGEFLWGRPFPYDVPSVNMNKIDTDTGKTYINFNVVHQKDGDVTIDCYHNTRNWWVSTSYNPAKNAEFVHFDDNCLRMQADATKNGGVGERNGIMRPGADPNKYINLARIDMTSGQMKVLHSTNVPVASAILATAGNVVFLGDILGHFRAFDDDTGAILWDGIVGGLITQSNITYMAGGKQYVMIFTGDTGGTGAVNSVGVVAALPYAPVTSFNAVWAFALP